MLNYQQDNFFVPAYTHKVIQKIKFAGILPPNEHWPPEFYKLLINLLICSWLIAEIIA